MNTQGVVFISDDLHRTQVADYPPIEGTDIVINGGKIGNGEITGSVVIWASTQGICIGGSSGYFKNLTERRLVYPYARYGAGLLKDNKYICTLEP